MEISTQFNEELNLRIHKVEGPIDVDQLKEMLSALYKSPEYDPNMNALWDLRAADFTSVTTEQVASMTGMVEKYWAKEGQSKASLIVSRDLDFGLSRMYEMLLSGSSPDKVMVFRDYDEAEKWLGD